MSSFVGPQCRYPSCYDFAFVDPRVNELREWCSDNHMRCAVQLISNNPELAYSPSPLGLRCKWVWRSLAGSVGYGPVAMVLITVVGMFVDTALPAGS